MRCCTPVPMRVLVCCVALAACDQGTKPPSPSPRSQPNGVLRGRVTSTMHGPGDDDGRTKPYERTSGRKCTVTATSAAHERLSVATNQDGAYELELPAGGYELSFADCANGCEGDNPVIRVVLVGGHSLTADWRCDAYAK